MAITSNVAYSGNGPTATGQIIADRTDAGNFARTLIGSVTFTGDVGGCLLYTSPSPRDLSTSRMPSSA